MAQQPTSQKERNDDYYWPVGDFVGPILFIAMAIFFIVGGLRMPTRGASGFFTAAGFTPVLLGSIVIVLNLLLMYLILILPLLPQRLLLLQTLLLIILHCIYLIQHLES